MNTESFIDWCVGQSISLSLDDSGNLKVNAVPGALTTEVVSQLKARKPELVTWLKAQISRQIRPREQSSDMQEVPIPLSFSQQRLWYMEQLETDTSHHNMVKVFQIKGPYEKELIEQAFSQIIARHEVLRSNYQQTTQGVFQIPRQSVEFALDYTDASGLNESSQQKQIQQAIEREAQYKFDLENSLLMRIALISCSDNEAVLLMNTHHIVSDGWSVGNIFNEFSALYSALRDGKEPDLVPLAVQYADFSIWQQKQLQQGSLEPQLTFWQERLNGIPQLHNLPLDNPRPKEQSFASACYKQMIDKALYQKVQQLAVDNEATPFMLLQTVFALLIGKFSGEQDVVIGVPDAGRYRKELEPLIGFFINTLVFRTRFNDEQSFRQILSIAKEEGMEVFANREVPFELLVEKLNPQRELAYNPIFQIKFLFEGKEILAFQPIDGMEINRIPAAEDRVRFDLDLSITETGSGLFLAWSYKTELFHEATIAQMAQSFEFLLKQIVDSPDVTISDLKLLNQADTETIKALGKGKTDLSNTIQLAHEVIMRQSNFWPQQPAVCWGQESLSYQDLNQKVSRLAEMLLDLDIAKGDRVAIYLPAGPALIIAILAVLKSTATYIPLDPANAKERANSILKDAEPAVILTEDAYLGQLPMAGHDFVSLDGWQEENWLEECQFPQPGPVSSSNDVAYIIYTSGSSGQPKGVEVTHGNLSDYCRFASGNYYHEKLTGSLVITSPSFDITVPSLFLPLMKGDSVAFLPTDTQLDELSTLLDGESDRLLRMTPVHVKALTSIAQQGVVSPAQHVFVIGGESLSLQLATTLQQQFPNSQIYNHYGPTEATVGCCLFDVSANLGQLSHSVPVGKAMHNHRLYLVDEQMRIVPRGVPGQLYIAGTGVAKGYLNRPQLTDSVFISCPDFAPQEDKVYATGDYMRFNANGDLEYLGRIDNQVKILGHRVEPEEVEQQLLTLPDIEQCAVVVNRDVPLMPKLIAYVVPTKEALADQTKLNMATRLEGLLPAHMRPSSYISLASLPLSDNGKVDRKSLAKRSSDSQHYSLTTERELQPASTETEKRLATIWGTLLGQNASTLSLNDSFFALGGQSLLAVKLVAEIRQSFDVELRIRDIMTHRELGALAEHLDMKQAAANMEHRQQDTTILSEGTL